MALNETSQAIPFHGYVETTGDALRLIQAARCGIIPRVTRRLNELERRSMIRSGAIFVFSVEESGIKRWTEGLQWSPSRIAGNFLVYKEVSERPAPRGNADTLGHKGETALAYKPYGLCKKTITVKIEGSDHHLVSYFTMEDIETGTLRRPSTRADIMCIEIPPELVQSTNFRYPPQIEAGPDGRLTRIRDVEEMVQPFDSPPSGNRAQLPSRHAGAPPSQTMLPRNHSPTESRQYRSPIPSRSISQQHASVGSPSPESQEAYRYYGHDAHFNLASSPDDSPHSPLLSQYIPFESVPSHQGHSAYPSYPSTGQSYAYSSTVQHQDSNSWTQHAPGAIQAGHTSPSSTTTEQHSLSRLVPEASAWSTAGHPLPGQPLASAPPMPSSQVAKLPTRRREHMRTRSTPSTWSADHNHGPQLHAPAACYQEGAHRMPTSPIPGYGHGHDARV
ncbi:Gti1/Pac2 family-domain-containing protein [Cristinia sonorae]|uniref:Gti1/Pac2 family-domain-containing protein n=1 Tax=Cristinia sonorae TaxID=1940300 RepID=A0A8K0UQZ9_9AGAR|nr:Gti1/Pac2 family-domain-containing protein [Cristinia sonorae]